MTGSAVAAPVRGVGLALLLQQGVAAWLHAVGTCCNRSLEATAVAPRVITGDDRRSRGPDVIPWAQHAEVAALLAGLVLSARPARQATVYSGECP